MRHVKGVDLHQRFPGISAFLSRYSLDLQRDLIPVRPAAHYLMGGIKTDLVGRTTVRGLYASGEAACTGVHGANRLASNSLLEGLVFGARAAQAMLADGLQLVSADEPENNPAPLPVGEEEQAENTIADLRRCMWALAGLLRDESTLREGLAVHAICEASLAGIVDKERRSRRLAEARALNRVADCILKSAIARTESRGAHYRNDYPARDDEHFQKHSIVTGDGKVRFEKW
jgi:L-aspartate oxidase